MCSNRELIIKAYRLTCSLMLMAVLSMSCDQNKINYENGAVPPEKGLETYDLADGFHMELFASEPLISDPVDMAIDENGVMYVVEMSGYPLDDSHTGKIKILKDKDGDGVMDESILFADQLLFPNGVMPWKKGVIVTDAPHVLYLEDVNGDGRSDLRDTILTGFSLSNPHVNVNNPIYGLDNWIYLSHFGRIGTRKYEDEFGDQGEEIRFWDEEDGPHLPPNANSKNVRFKTDGESLEMLSEKGQFGHTFDEWGHHFLTHNQNHIYEEVINHRYLNRNPNVVITQATEDVSDHGNSAEVFQITINKDRQLFTPVGLMTSSSGLIYYAGGLFPPPYDQAITFVCESVSNLVHSDRLTDNGATYGASRIEDRKEFLASRDSWARPVNMYIGPDGALYVLDYYRRIIEHPEWMSDEAIESGDLYDGHNMGRIYRISPQGIPPAQWTKGLDLGKSTSVELVKYLSDRNRWWRSNAQRLLVDRKDQSIVPVLEKEVRQSATEWGRLHALWTLEGMGELKMEDILTGLQDRSAGIRENAMRLAERYLDESQEMQKSLYRMVGDPSEKVRFQLLSTLGDLDNEEAKSAREKILFDDIEDKWVQWSALTAKRLDVESLLKETITRRGSQFVEPGQEATSKYDSFISKPAEMLGASKDKNRIISLLGRGMTGQSKDPVALQSAILKGLAIGLRRNKDKKLILAPEIPKMIKAFFEQRSDVVRGYTLEVLEELNGQSSSAIQNSMNRAISEGQKDNYPANYRSQMLKFLGLGDLSPYESEIKAFINPGEDPLVQITALEVFGKIPGTAVTEYVLKHWGEMTPKVRDEALNTFMSEKARVAMLLMALEEGDISKTELGWSRTVQLNQYHDEALRKRARAYLAEDKIGDVIASYQSSLETSGDRVRGLNVYKANCALCHQVRGELGVAFGPDLGTVHNWEAKALMANILDPAMAIAPGYDLWQIEMGNGDKVLGVISSETSNAIELKMGPESQKVVNRQEIKSIQSILGISLMPGFGGVLSKEEMADLIAYLGNSQQI
ncbi:MAG: c-type cytochrome [Saprospiraceae bacterium]|nr:c-type cytochrome [Saprospiraceae bacterium]